MAYRKLALLVFALGSIALFNSCATHLKFPLAQHPVNTRGWQDLIAEDLSNCTLNRPDSWKMENGALELVNPRNGADIWTKAVYGDFTLDLEFKVSEGANSGVFLRTADIKDMVMTGIEVQLFDSYGKEINKHSCGAIYDCLAPSKNTTKPAGEWNKLTITCLDNRIFVLMNGVTIIDMDLDLWSEAHNNPDGTRNKFNTAYKDMARVGHIGFQDHGSPVWYRNLRIKSLD